MNNTEEKKEFDRKIGNQIKYFREARGWSQEELASRMEVSATFVSRMERGVSGCNTFILNKVCMALELSPNLIMMWEEKEDISTTSSENLELTAIVLKDALRVVEDYNRKKK